MRKLLFLVNPAAGSGRAGETWRDLRASLPGLMEGRVLLESEAEMARRRLMEELEAPPGRVVVVGGDGSIRLAAEVILESGCEKPPSLGIVPAGTGSDLAASLRLPRDSGLALRRAVGGSASPLDVLEILTASARRFAVNVVSVGISGVVNEIAAAVPRRHAGTYLTATIRGLLRYRPLACRVEADGHPVYEGDILLLAAANAPTFGRGMRIAPDAHCNDGSIALIVVPRIPGWQLPWRLVQLYRGTHVGSPRVLSRKVESVRIVPLEPFPPFDLDGDPIPAEEAELRVLPGALRVVGGDRESGTRADDRSVAPA